MLAKELIDQLERRGLLDQEIIEALREQLDQGGTRITPEAVAKLLVDNGQLTRFQATKLIGEIRSGEYSDSDEAEVAEDDDLALFADEGEEVFEVEAEPEVVEAVEVEAVEVEAVEAVAVEEAGSVGDAMSAEGADRPVRRSARPKPPEAKSVWDSFKIYGYAGIIGLLLLSGGGLYFVLSRGDADDAIEVANKLYNQQNYAGAQDQYIGFLASFGEENQYSSISRTRIRMCELYRASTMSDPTRALDLADEILPEIENEEGMEQERGNLAALLVDIADNIAEKANDASETDVKKELLGRLNEQITLMDNPMYMTSSMRATLSSRLTAVEEARKRIERDISRNLKLDKAVVDMKTALDAKKTKEAYDIRFELLRDFPELESDSRVVELVKSASGIQETLVTASTKLPKTITGEREAESIRSIVLAARFGKDVPSLSDEVLYLRAGGSVLAFNAGNGKLLWRSFVGYGQAHAPVRLEGGAGVLLSESAKLEIQRHKGEDGSLRWRSQIGEPFSEPIAIRDDVYVATRSGTLLLLDAESGDAKWSAKIPQPLDVGPGVDTRANFAFVPGNHSNLYVLNTRNGSCIDSFYLGHGDGTIVVPPVPLLGHLFVIENAAADYARVHILKIAEDGTLTKAQDSVRMTGNVKIKPIIIQQRRLIVLTDRGQVSVYDVEPTAETEQVTVVARQLASYDEPTSTQMAVGKSQMWITGTRIGRYELQINTGRVVPDWFKHEGDTFIGEPFATDDALIHARILRGTSGVRVMAVEPKTGVEIWRNDVAVPIAMITQSDSGLHATTSQAGLFLLDRESLASGTTEGPIENPGGDGVAMRFENPVRVNDDVRVLVNQETSEQIAVYDPTRSREKLRLVTLSLPDGDLSGGAVFSGGGLFMPLDSGRTALMAFQTGKRLGSPFQPVSDPVGKMKWTNPVILSDDADQVVIADSRKAIYRLRVGENIRDLASGTIDNELLGLLAGVGSTAIGATAGPSADFVVGYDMGSLAEKFKTLLDGRVTWGPVSVGGLAVLQTDDQKMRAYDENGSQQFAVALPEGRPVGAPVVAGDKLIVSGTTGWIVVVDSASGQIVGQTDIGQPISAAPLPAGPRLLVPGAEGVVYIVPMPSNN
ncbi:PQQ-binding-like beta-propeller repeat protein [Planctomycetes bacterium K23_9]|uniref:Outer membrane biogenesis protein BamB n=1 Tax=Stieleria marina TaxID=1930275 RepID=A0A517NNM6_9BACT|nr:outer membrane biogenesis protein BamB [Planctomycetes bacterium K23_9]